MIEIMTVDLEQLTPDVLQAVANQIFQGEPKPKQKEKIEETLHKAPTLEQMKHDLEMYNKIASTLVDKIKQEEDKRKKDTHHLIEKKVRSIRISDKILRGTDKKDYQTEPKNMMHNEEIKYVREGNKIICTIKTPAGTFMGIARQHEDDKFRYEDGMTLAMVRARRKMYAKIESDLISAM